MPKTSAGFFTRTATAPQRVLPVPYRPNCAMRHECIDVRNVPAGTLTPSSPHRVAFASDPTFYQQTVEQEAKLIKATADRYAEQDVMQRAKMLPDASRARFVLDITRKVTNEFNAIAKREILSHLSERNRKIFDAHFFKIGVLDRFRNIVNDQSCNPRKLSDLYSVFAVGFAALTCKAIGVPSKDIAGQVNKWLDFIKNVPENKVFPAKVDGDHLIGIYKLISNQTMLGTDDPREIYHCAMDQMIELALRITEKIDDFYALSPADGDEPNLPACARLTSLDVYTNADGLSTFQLISQTSDLPNVLKATVSDFLGVLTLNAHMRTATNADPATNSRASAPPSEEPETSNFIPTPLDFRSLDAMLAGFRGTNQTRTVPHPRAPSGHTMPSYHQH